MIRATAELEAPAELLWQLLANTARWPEWGPSVRAVEPPAAIVTPGLRGRLRIAPGVWVPFVVTSVEPGRAWRWRVAGIDATGHHVEALGPTRCRVRFDVPAWAAPYVLVCKVALRRLARMVEPAGSARDHVGGRSPARGWPWLRRAVAAMMVGPVSSRGGGPPAGPRARLVSAPV